MKSLAVSALRQRFDQYARCGPEVTVDVSNTPTLTEARRADALVEFPSEDSNDYLGRGLIVEVQYANENKDFDAVTYDYLSAGYSVYWASPDDFTNDRFRIEERITARLPMRTVSFAPSTTGRRWHRALLSSRPSQSRRTVTPRHSNRCTSRSMRTR
jgi:hypothetical protein